MFYIFDVRLKRTLNPNNLAPGNWQRLEAAALFTSVSGRRSDVIVIDDQYGLYIIDTCNEAHAIPPSEFYGCLADFTVPEDHT